MSFAGSWKLENSENFEEYMKEVGVDLIHRKAAAALKPTLVIKIEGDKWEINQLSTFKNISISFTLGEEFEETTADGRVMKTTAVLDGGKLILNQKAIKDGDKDSVIERFFDGDKLVTTLKSGDVICRREYSRE